MLAPKQQIPTHKTPSGSPKPYMLPPLMTIETAAELVVSFAALNPKNAHDILLDASAVEHMSTPGLQALLALQKALAIHGGGLRIRTPSKSFAASVIDAGMQHRLIFEGDPHA